MEASEKKLSASPAGVVKPKPLEWNKYDEAVGFDCRYTVYQGGDGWTCVKYPHGDSHYRLAEGVPEADARAAAFADYSARIMSAIEPAGVGVETDDAAILLEKLKVMRGVYAMRGEEYTSRALHNIITEFEASPAALKGDEQ